MGSAQDGACLVFTGGGGGGVVHKVRCHKGRSLLANEGERELSNLRELSLVLFFRRMMVMTMIFIVMMMMMLMLMILMD